MDADALIGAVLGTNCTLQKIIGRGEMGVVFLAQQTRPKRQVAVKILQPGFPLLSNQYKAFQERFQREIDAVASLKHPNIIQLYECGEYRGLTYLVMPYISGGTLRTEMEQAGPFSLEKAVFYLEQMAAALDFAHDHGVIHGNVQPANILIQRENQLVLTDFGMVKLLYDGSIPDSFLVRARMPIETFDYMAPEQVAGDEIEAYADLYSLGVVLYQMLTGTVPFQSSMASQHQYIQPPAPRSLRPDLSVEAEQVMLKALASRPANRYQRVGDFAEAFQRALSTMPEAQNPPSFSPTSALLAASTSLDPVEQMLSSFITSPDNNNLDSTSPTPNSTPSVAKSNRDLTNTPPLPDSLISSAQASKDLQRTDVIKKTSFTLPSMSGFWLPSFSQAPTRANPASISPNQDDNTPPPPLPVSWPSWGWPEEEKADHTFMSQPTVPDFTQAGRSGVQPSPAKSGIWKIPLAKRKRLVAVILLIVLLILSISSVFAYAHINAGKVAARPDPVVSGVHGTAAGKVNVGIPTPSPVNSGNNGGSAGNDAGAGSRSFQVGAHPLLVIQGHGSDVNIGVGDTSTIVVTARRHGNKNNTGVIYNQEPDGQGHDRINISTNPGNISVDYDITVPSTTQVDVEIGAGSVTVAGISGATINTDSGSLNIQDVHGPVNVHTENGDITASTLSGSMMMQVTNGSIRLNDIKGLLKAVTHNGDVIVGEAVLSGASILQTNYGSVRFAGTIDPQGTYKLKTISGNVNLTLPDNTAFQLTARVGSGSVNNDFGDTVVGYLPRALIMVTIGSGSVTVNKAL